MKKVVATVSLAALLVSGCGGTSGESVGTSKESVPVGKYINPITEQETEKSETDPAIPYKNPPKIEPGIQGDITPKVGYRSINTSDIEDTPLERRKEELGYVLFSSWRAIDGFINMVKGINVDSIKSQNARIQSEHDQVQLDYEYFKQLFEKELGSDSNLQEIDALYKKTLAAMEGEYGDKWQQTLNKCKQEFANLMTDPREKQN